MGESEVPKLKLNRLESKKSGIPNVFDPAFSSLIVELPRKLQNCLKSRLERLAKGNEGVNTIFSSTRKEKRSSNFLDGDLEKQLEAWRRNPTWVDQPPEIKVSTPKGSLCNLNVQVNVGLPPDAVYNIVTDPDNRRVFKNIKEVISRKVLIDEGSRQVVEVEQAALWKFLWWSGTISVHVLVDQNRDDYSMKFKQLKAGFMKRFEGSWKVEPMFVDEQVCHPLKPKTFEEYQSCSGGCGRVGSKVTLEQLIQPAIVPPPPISWYLRGITTKTTEMLIHDLLAEAASIRGIINSERSDQDLRESLEMVTAEKEIGELRDVKERWMLRRKKAKNLRINRF